MKVLYIAAECKPFSKAGGVGDVAGELPAALKARGVDVEVLTPLYGGKTVAGTTDSGRVRFLGRDEPFRLIRNTDGAVPVTLVDNATYFNTDYRSYSGVRPLEHPELFREDYRPIYVNSPLTAYYDDALRFSFFCEVGLEVVRRQQPDIVHVNDWPLGYLFAHMVRAQMPQRRVLTIHNIGYQGNIGRSKIAGWPMEQFERDSRTSTAFSDPHPAWNSVNALRLGMELAHRVNTVSPTYMREMLEPEDQSRYFEGGKGLETVARKLREAGRLEGILNGFEYKENATDDAFDRMIEQKNVMKALLAPEFEDGSGLLLGFVGRAVEQKFKLLEQRLDGAPVLEHILGIPGVNLAMVATGEKRYEELIRKYQGRPNVSALIDFNPQRASQVTLGSDIFLMPSLFEPCGITQLESLSCATPPLVRWTGGLVDTVVPHTASDGTGFGFDGDTGPRVLRNLVAAVQEGARLFREAPDRFRAMQRQGFRQRFLWSTAATRYIDNVYEPALTDR